MWANNRSTLPRCHASARRVPWLFSRFRVDRIPGLAGLSGMFAAWRRFRFNREQRAESGEQKGDIPCAPSGSQLFALGPPLLQAPRRGVEPRPADPKSAVPSVTLAGREYPGLDLNQGLDLRRVQCYPLHHRDKINIPTRIRTGARTLGPSDAFPYTIGTWRKDEG